MIQSDPPITSVTISTPKASVVGVVRAGGQVEEEHQMHAHLRHGERDQRGRNGGPVDEPGEAAIERRRRQGRRQHQADQIAAHAVGDTAAVEPLLAWREVTAGRS